VWGHMGWEDVGTSHTFGFFLLFSLNICSAR
jgi:hypothetical protein